MCSQFVSNVQGNQERATNIILNNELLLLKYVSSNTVTELRSSPPPLFTRAGEGGGLCYPFIIKSKFDPLRLMLWTLCVLFNGFSRSLV